MPCFHPAKMFDVSAVYGQSKTGKKQLKYCQYEVDYLFYDTHTEKFIKLYHKNINLQDYYNELKSSPWRYVECPFDTTVPCGKCDFCRFEHSKEWANRMILEMQYHTSAWFITLTYNDQYAFSSDVCRGVPDPGTGEIVDYVLSLVPKDLTDFWKRVRASNPYPIKYFACGEYGDKTHRPHYHAIVFDLVLDDLELIRSQKGNNYYTSAALQKYWSVDNTGHNDGVPIGNVLVCPVTWASCAYVARYCTKKLSGSKNAFFDDANIEPMFQRQSQGFAKDFYLDHKDEFYQYDKISVATDKKGISFRPPRYFDKLLEVDDPELLFELKKKRMDKAISAQDLKMKFSEFDFLDQLAIDEAAFKDRVKYFMIRDQI